MTLLSSKVTQLLLSLGILVVLLIYLIFGSPTFIGSQISRLNTAADSYLIEGKSWQYNQRGELNHLLKVDSLFHYKNIAKSKLEKPILQVFKIGQLAWTASAMAGSITHDTNTIELESSVNLHNDQKKIRLTTSAMTINPAQKTAQSNQHTLIVNNENRIEAESIYADLSSNIVSMKSRVKSYYAKP